MDPIITIPVFILSILLGAAVAAWAGWFIGKKAGSRTSFQEGKEKGRIEAYSDFGIVYKPFVDRRVGLLKSEATTGYEMQLFVKGLPVGDPTRRVLENSMKIDKQTTEQILNTVIMAVQPQVAMLREGHLMAQVVAEKLQSSTARQISGSGAGRGSPSDK